MSRKLGAVLAASLLFSTIANAALINLSPFLVIQYELFDQPDANDCCQLHHERKRH